MSGCIAGIKAGAAPACSSPPPGPLSGCAGGLRVRASADAAAYLEVLLWAPEFGGQYKRVLEY